MQRRNLLTDGNAVAAGTSYECRSTPFVYGRHPTAVVTCNGFTGTVKIQTSDDDSTWTDVATVTGTTTDRTELLAITLKPWIRANVTARCAGSVSVDLFED